MSTQNQTNKDGPAETLRSGDLFGDGYRPLKKGEKIVIGDEALVDGKWELVTGWALRCEYSWIFLPIRRARSSPSLDEEIARRANNGTLDAAMRPSPNAAPMSSTQKEPSSALVLARGSPLYSAEEAAGRKADELADDAPYEVRECVLQRKGAR